MPKTARTTVKKTAVKKAAKKPVSKKKQIGKNLVKKKPYIELVTALLSIPVLITITILNLNTLQNLNKAQPTPSVVPGNINTGGFYAAPVGEEPSTDPSQGVCFKGLGQVDISTPGEGDVVTDNPVTINIDYDDTTYCRAAWSYRINGGSWSGYDDRSVALYNLPQGQITFELRVKSIVTADEKTLTRKFEYKGRGSVLVPDPQSSGSAN